MVRWNRSGIAALLMGLLALIGGVANVAAIEPAISPIEAAHLVEARVAPFSISRIEPAERDQRPIYLIEGSSGADKVTAIVDARVARLLSVEKNGASLYRWPGVVVVGHRGTVKFGPENTIAAFNAAIDQGADILEMDIRETKDGQLVIMHDATVNRTTDGSGLVTALKLEEIKKLDAGSWLDPKFKGEPVPTLREVLKAIEGRALPDIDFKAGDPVKLVAVLKEFGLLGKITLYCGDLDLMRRTLELDRGFMARPTARKGRMSLPGLIADVDPPIVNMDWVQFTEPLVVEVHLSGKKAFVNTMGPNDNEWGIQQAIDAGADYIQSDQLDLVIRMLREQGLHK